MAVGKSSIQRAVNAGTTGKSMGTKRTAAKAATTKATAVKKTNVKTTAAKDVVVSEAVLTPMNSEEIQVKFMKATTAQPKTGASVRITEELPTHLL